MCDYSNNNMLDEERKAIVEQSTMAAIMALTNEIEAYERKYPDKSEEEVLKLGLSKRWYYFHKLPEFPFWRDWFIAMAFSRAIENISSYEFELTFEEKNFIENLINKTMDEFPAWKSKGGYYRQRIGFRKFND
jgi:hypothetical protein